MLLLVNPGAPDEESYPLPVGRVTIGRTRDNAVSFVHKSLSRTHASVEFDGGRVRVTDLESKNGVFVNGKRVKTAEIFEGDTFRCGDITFALVRPSPAPRPRSSDSRMSGVAKTLPSPLGHEPQAVSKRPTRIPGPLVRVEDDGRAAERFFALVRATELVIGETSLDRLLDELVVVAAQTVEVDRLALLALDEETLELRPRVLKSFVPLGSLLYSRRVIDWVVDRGAAAVFGDVAKDTTLPGDPREDADVRAAIAVPVNVGSGTVGVLYGDSTTRTDLFRPDDVALFRALANLVAVGLEGFSTHRRDLG